MAPVAAACVTLSGLTGLAGSALAQAPGQTSPGAGAEWPQRPVRLMVPYAPGGVADIAARLLGTRLAEQWRQTVTIENRTGGGGTVAADTVAKAPPDGSMLLVATVSDYAIFPHLYAKLPYSIDRDLVPIVIATDNAMLATAAAGAPFSTLAELVAWSKTQAGGVSYSSPSLGSINHLLTEQLAFVTGAKLVHVPYKGGAPAAAAVASGEVPLGMLALSSAAPHVKSARVRGLAVTSAARASSAPNLPTMAEAGVAGVVGTNWVGIAAPTGTPAEVIRRVNQDVNRLLRQPELIERLAAVGAEPAGSTPEEFAARIRDEGAVFARTIERLGLKVE
jgi:tripartite-type tricarboxylate transporter receptor subunit TctC